MTTSQINPSQLRPSDDDGRRNIIHVGLDRQNEAIERLVTIGPRGDRDHARRFLEYARSNRINLDNLWARIDHMGGIEFTVLTVPSPGRTAMVFASHPLRAGDVRSLAGLIDHACQHLDPRRVNLAQALLDPGEDLERDSFLRGGFADLATLSYLERPVRQAPGKISVASHWPLGVSVETYRESFRSELINVLDQTYEDTLDCPGLRGHRRTEDILEGHRASGAFDASLWMILRVDGVAAGALLLNPSNDGQAIELVYLGLAKPVRGRGLGAQLLRHGLGLLQNRRESSIHLAVDESNAPAIALYKREGFRPSLRRKAMIRPHSGA